MSFLYYVSKIKCWTEDDLYNVVDHVVLLISPSYFHVSL